MDAIGPGAAGLSAEEPPAAAAGDGGVGARTELASITGQQQAGDELWMKEKGETIEPSGKGEPPPVEENHGKAAAPIRHNPRPASDRTGKTTTADLPEDHGRHEILSPADAETEDSPEESLNSTSWTSQPESEKDIKPGIEILKKFNHTKIIIQ